ncbi:MAG: hypothetical protein WCK91_02290 [bacterium]
MTEIVPAILATDFEELRQGVSKFVHVVPIVQIDICDGVFVPSSSWPYTEIKSGGSRNLDSILNEEEGLPHWDSMAFELDLMVHDAHEYFDFFMKLGPKRIVFHIEAEGDNSKFKEFLESIDPYIRDSLEIGVAVDTHTDIQNLEPIILLVDFVQCMGIARDGYQGEDFDERCLSQIKSLHTKYPELIISVDGAVDDTTAPQLVDAGASRLVVGSFLADSYDAKDKIRYLQSLHK